MTERCPGRSARDARCIFTLHHAGPCEYDAPPTRQEVYRLVDAERDKQMQKFPGRSVSDKIPPLRKLCILMEEVGEVAEALDETDANTKRNLRAELVQVAACAVGWLESP